MTNVTGNRFERATDDEIEQFAAHQLSSNTKKSTKSCITLLERYKVEAFGWTGSFVDLEEDLVRLLQSFFQKIRKEYGETYEPGSLNTMYLLRYSSSLPRRVKN